MTRSHLIIALSGKAWGRAVMACTIAAELSATGDRVTLLINECLAPLTNGAGFRSVTINESLGPLLGLYIDHLIATERPTSVVLSDYFANANFCYAVGANPRCVLLKDIATFSLDPWHFEWTGTKIDMFCGETFLLTQGSSEDCTEQFQSIPYKLRPVPIVPLGKTNGAFRNLPHISHITTGSARETRHALGISDGAKAVLFCTAKWQHAKYESRAGMRLASSLPILVAEYLSRIGQDVHLVHVGPYAYDLQGRLNGRYHWLPPLSLSRFDSILASMDLFISANISATTVTKAMVFEVPTVVLHNSILAETQEQVESALARPFSESLRLWLKDAVPLFPFVLWPLGYHRFLAPLLHNNPYVDALEFIEFLDEQRVESTLADLLFDSTRRADQLHSQTCYLKQIRSLPTGAEIIRAMMRG
ncbi:MAG TPA: DUF6365 family protein [Terriglobia bacterium]|nr:DUF6365 family protein [Terriglobia bacterium]